MNSRREQALVGVFVIVAVAILVATVLAVSGTFSKKGVAHRTYFKYAGGLVAGTPVRYGGFVAGRIETLRVDPRDSGRIEIDFNIGHEIPLKTDSVAKIAVLGVLGENYLELTTGTNSAPLATPGSVVKSKELIGIDDLTDMLSALAPSAEQVLKNLNERLIEMKVTLAETNDLLGPENRANIKSSLGTVNSMLTDSRPKVAATLTNVQSATGKLDPILNSVQTAADKITPLLDDVKGTIKQANDALAHVDAMITDNSPDVRATVTDTRKTLSTVSELVDSLKGTLDHNTGNIDDILANIRATTENLKELTDTLKRNPSTLIRGEIGKDRKPGDKQ
jgi:phospholipid/cholesterol/gamma-HCH transport system substrate-binding protein